MQSVLVGSKLCCALETMYKPLSQTPNAQWPSASATGNTPRSSSVNQHCLPRASPARREESLREGTSQGLLLCNTPKNRVAALLPRTVSRTTRVEAGPPPPPPAWPARNLLLETQRRRREKDTSLGRLVKRVSRSNLRWRCWPSKSVVSRRIVRSDIIPFDSRPRIARANREN